MNTLRPKILFTCLVILVLGIISGCKDDTPEPILIIPEVKVEKRNVLIANKGTSGDGSLSIYETLSKEVRYNVYETFSMEVRHNVYQEANGEKLGGTLVALTQIDDKYYFVLQDVGKIIVTDSSFRKVGEFSGLKSPSQLYKVAKGKAYVSSATAEYLTIIDLEDYKTTGVIGTGAEVTHAVVKDSFFICLVPSQNTFLEIDGIRDSITDIISAYGGLKGIFLDNNNLVRLYSDGDYSISTWFRSNGENVFQGALLRGRSASVVYSSVQDKFYYIHLNDNSIWESEVEFRSARSKLFVKVDEVHEELQTLAIDPLNGDAFTSYQMKGSDSTRVLCYSQTGQLINEFSVPSPTSNFFFP
tara:strand:- start:201 stop:1274 length:1074 start_codon:yes stop_codon:yes gene_type:complete